MELKFYLRVLWRRWPIIVAVPLLVGLLAIVQEVTRDASYTTHAKLRIIAHQLDGDFTDYPADDNFIASEYAIDDMVEAVRGNVFAEAVADRVRSTGLEMSHHEIVSAISATREHRVLTVTVSSGDPARAEAIARAATAELEASAFNYIGMATPESDAVVQVIDQPGEAAPDNSRARLLLLLEVIAAAGAGVLLAFLIDYLDDTFHDGETAAATLGVPHLANVPVERST
jgi:capsular polysaccharide biosynthesis protein